jgi:hypothetical protein
VILVGVLLTSGGSLAYRARLRPITLAASPSRSMIHAYARCVLCVYCGVRRKYSWLIHPTGGALSNREAGGDRHSSGRRLQAPAAIGTARMRRVDKSLPSKLMLPSPSPVGEALACCWRIAPKIRLKHR